MPRAHDFSIENVRWKNENSDLSQSILKNVEITTHHIEISVFHPTFSIENKVRHHRKQRPQHSAHSSESLYRADNTLFLYRTLAYRTVPYRALTVQGRALSTLRYGTVQRYGTAVRYIHHGSTCKEHSKPHGKYFAPRHLQRWWKTTS